MTAETHFAQAGDGPVLIGSGAGELRCGCGQLLIQGYEPVRFLAVGVQCGHCGTVTTTPPLPEGDLPPRSAIVASPAATPRFTAMTVPAGTTVIGQAEMNRLQAMFQPARPDNIYQVSNALLDEVEALFARHTGAGLPGVEAGSDGLFAGLREQALTWAVRHLRQRMREDAPPDLADPATACAVIVVTAFMHFVATWSHHPLFPVMVETAADRGFSLHGLAPFAAAHCLTMLGNQIRFPELTGYPQRIEHFSLVADPDTMDVRTDVFDRFDFPFGAPWDAAGLRAAVLDRLAAAQGQINLRHPGLLVLSPGAALSGFDEALIEAIKSGVQAIGRKNRGLMAATPVVLRLQPLPEAGSVRFGYGFFPILNRHYSGPGLLQAGG